MVRVLTAQDAVTTDDSRDVGELVDRMVLVKGMVRKMMDRTRKVASRMETTRTRGTDREDFVPGDPGNQPYLSVVCLDRYV